jgi:hypothetical protein
MRAVPYAGLWLSVNARYPGHGPDEVDLGEAFDALRAAPALVLPLMLVLAAVVFVLLPVVGVVQAIVALGVVAGRRSRWRALRLWVFAAVYCAGECLCVLACLLLWLASPVPRWRDGDWWQVRGETNCWRKGWRAEIQKCLRRMWRVASSHKIA